MSVLSKLSKRERTIVYVAIFLGVVGVWNYFFLNKDLEKLEDIKKEISLLLENLKQDTYIIRDKEKIEKAYEAKKGFIERVSSIDQSTGVSAHIDKLATEAGVIIVKNAAPDIDCQGHWKEIITFLYRISTADILLSVDRLSLSPDASDPTMINVKMSVSYRVIP